MLRRLCLAVLLLTLVYGPVCAATLPQPGERAIGVITLLDKPIRLPPGEWQVASSGFGRIAGGDPGPYGAIGGVLLVRSDSPTGGFLLLHTNLLPVRAGWGQPAECAAEDALFQSVGETRNLHNACSFVIATRRSKLLRSSLPALGDEAAKPELAAVLPSWALLAGLRVSDRRDMLDLRYGIAPRHPAPAGWLTGEPVTDPAYLAVVRQLGDWTQSARASVVAAMRDPIEQVPAIPTLNLAPRAATEDGPQEQITALRLGLYKLATYRVPSTTFTFAVSSIAAGQLYLGAIITFWQGLTHSAVYLGNELAWEWPSPVPVMTMTAAAGSANGGGRSSQRESPVRLAANSNSLPAQALDVRNSFAVDGKQVPLPPGRWTLLGTQTSEGVTGSVLGQTEAGALRALVVVHSNADKTSAILGPSAECRRSDILFAVTRYDTPDDGFCLYGKRVAPGAGADNPLWAQVTQRLSDDGIAVPATLLMAGARARTQGNFVDARYYFVSPANWVPTGAALQNWADLTQEGLETGVRGRLPAATGALPWPWDEAAVAAVARGQANKPLQDLAAAGVISTAELAQQTAAAETAQAEREQQRLSLWSRSFLKVATYRIGAYLDTFAVQTFFTASPAQGVVVATVHAVSKPLLAYGNELYWAHSGLGKAPATLLSASFPEIGVDQR